MLDPDQFHDPEFQTLALAARAVIAERVRRGIATPDERLVVAVLNEIPTADDIAGRERPGRGEGLGALGRVPGCGSLRGARDVGAVPRHRRVAGRRCRPGGRRRRRRDDALTTMAAVGCTPGLFRGTAPPPPVAPDE